jgi:hypothetical protein
MGNKIKPISVDNFVKDILSDPENKRIYESMDEEFQIIEEILKARIRKNKAYKRLTGKDIEKPYIASFETRNGNFNPTLNSLKKIAKSLDSRVVIKFEPIE